VRRGGRNRELPQTGHLLLESPDTPLTSCTTLEMADDRRRHRFTGRGAPEQPGGRTPPSCWFPVRCMRLNVGMPQGRRSRELRRRVRPERLIVHACCSRRGRP
jgi:hypothetical protein